MSLDVLTLGEAMLLLVAGESGPLEKVRRFSKRTAGAETNVAIGLARLGLKVGWQSRLGADSMARYLLATMRGVGIDTRCQHGDALSTVEDLRVLITVRVHLNRSTP